LDVKVTLPGHDGSPQLPSLEFKTTIAIVILVLGWITACQAS
jgi:hypothetical protein